MTDQAIIDDANQKINDARAELEKARSRFQRIYNRQSKIILAEFDKTPMTLAMALESYLPGSDSRMENSAGYDFLNHRTYKGDWKGLRISASGASYTTGQRIIQFRVNARDTDEHLDLLAAELIALEPIVKAGYFAACKEMHYAGEPKLADAKVFDIMDYDCCESQDPKLLFRPDGTWELIDARHFRYGGSILAKGLKECLEYIRINYYSEIK